VITLAAKGIGAGTIISACQSNMAAEIATKTRRKPDVEFHKGIQLTAFT
jgi:hypothetical protein